MPIRREDFERDRAIVAARVQSLDAAANVDVSSAKGQVQICVAAFVVVQVHMTKALAVGFENFLSSIVRHLQIRMANIEVQSQFGNGI